MEIKKYDKVPLNQLGKSSSTNEIPKQASQFFSPLSFIRKDDVPIQKSKSKVSINNKKSCPSEKSFQKDDSPQIQAPLFFIRTKDNTDIKINMEQVSHLTILELKKMSFPTLFEENKNIRLIFKGKLLQDNEIVHKTNIKIGDFIHAFISEKVEKKPAPSTNTTNISNFENSRANNIRGFERMREFGVSEEDIVLQRFKFHSHYSLIDKEENLELTNLYNREDEWYAMHLENITNNVPNTKKWFKSFDFYQDIQKELILNGNFFDMIIASIFGFFFFLAVILLLFKKKMSYRVKEGLLLGIILKIIYISFNFYISGAIRWLI